MKRLITLVNILIIIFGIATFAGATLIDRGGGLIYDDDLDITWLQDANYAKTSGYDGDGRMTWKNATTWAETLVYGGFDDWRLPITLQPDPSCGYQAGSGSISYGPTCTGSEMGHLFYAELGGTAWSSILTSLDPDLALFTNLQWQGDGYWSGTGYRNSTSSAWNFYFNDGSQWGGFDYDAYAWAVRDGDVASVPEPSTMLLLGSGLAGILLLRKRYLI